MDNFNNKNYFIENKNSYKKSKQLKSVNGINCIGPCYPANTVIYHPTELNGTISDKSTCPIKIDNKNTNKQYVDMCDVKDINNDYLTFDIFDNSINIASTDDIFLYQIYDIKNISDVVYFFSYSIDTLPIYTQRRLLKSIFNIYYKYIEFPKKIFIQKLIYILKNIYKIDINEKNAINNLDTIYKNSSDLYKYNWN